MNIKSCVVHNCGSNSIKRPDLCFFGLPKIKSVKQEWLEILAPHLPKSPLVFVCELHFKEKDFRTGPKKELKNHAVPLLKLGKGSNDPVDSEDEFMVQDEESKPNVAQLKPVKVIKEEPLSDEESSSKPGYESTVISNTGRRPSRRAAIAAAQKISSIVSVMAVPEPPTTFFGKTDTIVKKYSATSRPITSTPSMTALSVTPALPATPALSEVPNLSMTPADISLDMECYEEDLSEIQSEIYQDAQNHYNLVMKGLKDLVQCSGKMVQTDASGTMILNTLPFPTQTGPSIPSLNPLQPNTLFFKTDNAKMIPISMPNTKPSFLFM